MLDFINKYIDRIFYAFLVFHVALMIKVIFINSSFDYYITFQSNYDLILTISNGIFIALLFLKTFASKITISREKFLNLMYNNKKLTIIGIFFFILFVTDQILEDEALSALQAIHMNTLPLHIIIYIITIYKGFSQYKDMFQEYNLLETTPSKIYSEILSITKGGIEELAILSAFIAIAGKINLATYILHHLNIAIFLMISTSLIIFIALFITYKVKRNKV